MDGGVSATQVFLTRPAGRNGTAPRRLRALGLCVHELPALELRPLAPASGVPLPSGYDLIVFVSRYAVQRYFALLADTLKGAEWPAGTVAATVGASSAQALFESGLIPSENIVHPPADTQNQDSEALLSVVHERGLPVRRVLIVRGTQGRQWLASTLAERGIPTDFLAVYERVPADWPTGAVETLQRALQKPAQSVFLLTSSEGVLAIAGRLREMGLLSAWAQAAFVVLHERIGATLQSVLASQPGASVRRLELCTPDEHSIVEAIYAVARSTAKP